MWQIIIDAPSSTNFLISRMIRKSVRGAGNRKRFSVHTKLVLFISMSTVLSIFVQILLYSNKNLII